MLGETIMSAKFIITFVLCAILMLLSVVMRISKPMPGARRIERSCQ